jgi:hypothetical protein
MTGLRDVVITSTSFALAIRASVTAKNSVQTTEYSRPSLFFCRAPCTRSFIFRSVYLHLHVVVTDRPGLAGRNMAAVARSREIDARRQVQPGQRNHEQST